MIKVYVTTMSQQKNSYFVNLEIFEHFYIVNNINKIQRN